MGFGGGSLASQDQSLIASLLGQEQGLANQQGQYMANVNLQDSATVQAYNTITRQLLGQTKPQQKKDQLGVMDFIKTSPGGLANTPANTGTMGLV